VSLTYFVHGQLILIGYSVPHGWDKAPNPLRESPGARQQYMVACKELRRMFEIDEDDEEDHKHADLPCRKYHKSVDMGKLQVPQA